MTHRSIVSVCDLSHRYATKTVLSAVTFSIEAPEVFGVLGPNGSGKTTLFRVLSTSLVPTSGRASMGAFDVVSDPRAVRLHIGIVFQKPSLDGKLSVCENLHHQGYLYGLHGGELRERCSALLSRFGLDDRSGDRVDRLSGGLQRRVELAKSLLHRPRVLVLDEPSTGLDPAARAGFMDQLCELRDRDGVTSLVTTHLMDEAERCDRLAVFDEGRLIALDSPAALRSRVGGDVIAVSVRNPDRFAAAVEARFGGRVAVVDGVVRLERDLAHAFVPELIEAFPGEIDSVTVGRPTLEDAFVNLTGLSLSSADDAPPAFAAGVRK